MSTQGVEDFAVGNENFRDSKDESSPKTKLERRRRIEELFEEKRLREELAEYF